MTVLQFPSFHHHEDHVYAPRDEAFDIRAICTEEGLVICTADDGSHDFLGKYAIDESFINRNRE